MNRKLWKTVLLTILTEILFLIGACSTQESSGYTIEGKTAPTEMKGDKEQNPEDKPSAM